MAAFDFTNLKLQHSKIYHETQIEIDGIKFNPNYTYTRANQISFENNNGKVVIHGFLNLSDIKINDIAKLGKFSLKFDPKFLNKCATTFNSITCDVIFNHIDRNEPLDKIEAFLYSINALDVYMTEDRKLSFSLNTVREFDYYSSYNKENLNYSNGKLKGKEAEEEDFFILNKINKPRRKIKDEEGKNKSYEFKSEGIIESFEEKTPFERESYDKQVEVSTNFIDFAEEEPFLNYFNKGEAESKNLVNPQNLTVSNNNYRNAFRVCFNHRGQFITRPGLNDPNSFRFQLNVNQITPNSEAGKFKEDYARNTMIKYIDNIKSELNSKKQTEMDVDNSNDMSMNINHLGINDYTFLLNNYIGDLTIYKDTIKNILTTQHEIGTINSLVTIEDYCDKEITTLKLFRNLFLNCYLSESTPSTGFERDVNNTKSLREEVRKMRKKKFVDWVVSSCKEIKKYSNDDVDTLILKELLIGRMKNAVELCNKNGLNILSSLISQTNNDTKAKLMEKSINHWKQIKLLSTFTKEMKSIYLILAKQPIDDYKDIISNLCNWKQILTHYAVNMSKPEDLIPAIVKEFDQAMSCLGKEDFKFNNGTMHFDYLLLKLIEAIESKPIEIRNILNLMGYSSNLFHKSSDHHLQFIIFSILLETIHETYSYIDHQTNLKVSNWETFYLKELHFNLLIKCIEELMMIKENWKYAIYLVKFSNISRRVKDRIIEDIVYRSVPYAKDDQKFFDSQLISDVKVSHNALGYYLMSTFNFTSVYEEFINADNFSRANEVLLFNSISKKIIENNKDSFTNELKHNLSYLSKYNLEKWEKYGKVFHEYIKVFTNTNYAYLNKGRYNYLLDLIKRIEGMNIDVDVTKEKIINCCRNVMLFNLRSILNNDLNASNRKEFNVCLTPNSVWIEDKFISRQLKLKEFNASLESLIEMKSKTLLNN